MRIDGNLLALTLVVTIVGGLIVAAASVTALPLVVISFGCLLFLLGLVIAFVLGYRDSRRRSIPFVNALGQGLRTLWRWLWAFMP